MPRNARNTSIAPSRLKYGVRLPFEAKAGEDYAAPGPVKTYVLEGKERQKYAPVRPTLADLKEAAAAGWPWRQVAATWKLKGARANALREVYYRLTAGKEEAEVEQVEQFEVYGAEQELASGVNPRKENAPETRVRVVQGVSDPEAKGQVGPGGDIPEIGAENGQSEEGKPEQNFAKATEQSIDSETEDGLDPVECVRRGLPLERARRMTPKDLTPEIARELLAAGVSMTRLAWLYNYKSTGSFSDKLARWGVRPKPKVKPVTPARDVAFDFSGLACPWPPGLEARVARLERLLEDIAPAEEHGAGKDTEERHQHVLDNLVHLAVRVQELARDLEVVKLALADWAERIRYSARDVAARLDAAGFSNYHVDYERGVVYVFFPPAWVGETIAETEARRRRKA